MTRLLPVLLLIAAPVLAQPIPLPPAGATGPGAATEPTTEQGDPPPVGAVPAGPATSIATPDAAAPALSGPPALSVPYEPEEPAPSSSSPAELRLAACMVQAQTEPASGLAAALDWETQGGGTMARRCGAAAKLAGGRPAAAARDFEDLAHELVILDPETAITLYRRAGEAWIVADEPMRAQGIVTEGLKTAPGDPGLLLVRATASMALSDLSDAKASLDRAILADPDAPQLYVMRGVVEQGWGHNGDAMIDAQWALSLDPHNVDALLLRGRLRFAKGDRDGALADWHAVLEISRDGPAAREARSEIAMADGTP